LSVPTLSCGRRLNWLYEEILFERTPRESELHVCGAYTMNPPLLIDSADGSAYLSDVRSMGGIVALLGSGISMWAPSNMPNGQRITDELANIIASTTVSSRSTVMDRIKSSAFEHIMERYPKQGILRSIVAGAYHPTPPNPVHEAFARLLSTGVVEHIITTNYDVGLESACSAICSPTEMPQVVVAESNLTTATITKPILFKIHGCAASGNEASIILTLGGEGEMPDWKRALLRRLINGRHLLVCGYSGLDFEICPELIRLAPSQTTWNSYQDPRTDEKALTANAKRVLEATNGTPLVGDMNKMLQSLTGKSWSADASKISPDLVRQMVNALDDWELDKWRARVLNGLGCALDGVHTARRMYLNSGASKERQSDSLLAMGEALFHSGLYKQAGRAYREATLLSSGCGNWDKIVKAEVGVIESDRVAGRWLRAHRRMKKAARTLPRQAPPEEREKVVNEIMLKRVLLHRYTFYLARLLRLPALIERIRRQVKQDMIAVSAYSARQGSWFNLQHCEMLAGKFSIPFSEIYSGPMTPPAAHEGYQHLGYILAEMMAYRALLADPSVSNPPLNIEYFRIAQELGINPEVWKLARAMEKRFGSISLPSTAGSPGATNMRTRLLRLAMPFNFNHAVRSAWETCEYTIPMRLLLRLRGEEA
jgi:hypothetical protein